MSLDDKTLVWLHGEVKSPPFTAEARIEAGYFAQVVAERRIAIAAAFQANADHRSARP